jgi:kumamolisin
LAVKEVSKARRTVILNGSLAALSRAFGVALQEYKNPNVTFRGRTGPLQIPADLQDLIQGVFGLDDRPQASAHFRRLDKQSSSNKGHTVKAYSPLDVAAAYDFPSNTDGSGQCLALIELSGQVVLEDLVNYGRELSIPIPAIKTVGKVAVPRSKKRSALGVTTAIQVVGSVAPGAKIVVYLAENTDAGLLNAITTAIHDQENKPSVICIPWGAAECLWTYQAMSAIHQAFEVAAAVGVTVCVAAGDDGSSDGIEDGLAHVDFPASSPYALACGGTRLQALGNSTISESVWNRLASGEGATGGGISDSELFLLPAWQASLGVPRSVNKGRVGRGIPDVAANADPYTGYVVNANGESDVVGGTGAAAALWSGLIMRINQHVGRAVGYINPFLARYASNPRGFNNITLGNNGDYAAGPGWNACTGHGTPRGKELAALLATGVEELARPAAVGFEFSGSATLPQDNAEHRNAVLENPRYTNVCIVKSQLRAVLPLQRSLRAGGQYELKLNIGSWTRESAVRNARPFRGDLLPVSADGHWLEVVIASDDFQLTKNHYDLFLPRRGSSYICSCKPGIGHTCHANERLPYLFVSIHAPALSKLVRDGSRSSPLRSSRLRRARLRIAIYFRKNLVESQLLTAAVQRVEAPGRGYSSRIDYSLTSRLSDLDFLPERTVNILTNDNSEQSHKLIINRGLQQPIIFNVESARAGLAIAAARDTLKSIGVKEYGGALGAKVQLESRYDRNNSKPKSEFIADLRTLASFGWRLWSTLFQGRPEGRRALSAFLNGSTRHPAIIQVSRTESSTMMFPWSLVYDIPLESDTRRHILCPFLEAWDAYVRSVPDACPFAQQHQKNTICPFGFWGINHIIEQPPSMPEFRKLPLEINKSKAHDKPQLVMGISLALDPEVTRAHKTKLEQNLTAIQVLPKNSREEIEKALAEEELELLYFYCHGKRESLAGTGQATPYIEVGQNETITPDDITAWQMGDSWSENHWKKTSPLVFINGCHTVELTPELLINFVDSFVGVYAAGVIGTEILLLQSVASEAAEHVLAAMNSTDDSGKHIGVGEAIRKMRLYFLAKGNLLGLAYTPYCSADLKLAV